jgi:NAD(P)H-dependent FMN reductase
MVTLISGTNRPGSNTRKITRVIAEILQQRNISFKILDLQDIQVLIKDEAFMRMEEELLHPTTHYWIVLPEYNGSYPGVLKCLIDNSDVAQCWHYKKVMLTGVATGRAGNLRGMEHLTGSLMHMKMLVHPNRVPISQVNKILDQNDHLTDPMTLQMLNQQADQLMSF